MHVPRRQTLSSPTSDSGRRSSVTDSAQWEFSCVTSAVVRDSRRACGLRSPAIPPTSRDSPRRWRPSLTNRTAIVERATRETSIRAQLVVDGSGQAEVRTGIGFLDHLLESLVRHARFDLTLQTNGDLHVDDHHTAEDSALAQRAIERLAQRERGILGRVMIVDVQVADHHTAEDSALALGEALDRALGERRGIARFGWAYAPLDESLARAVVDLSGRAFADVSLGLRRES